MNPMLQRARAKRTLDHDDLFLLPVRYSAAYLAQQQLTSWEVCKRRFAQLQNLLLLKSRKAILGSTFLLFEASGCSNSFRLGSTAAVPLMLPPVPFWCPPCRRSRRPKPLPLFPLALLLSLPAQLQGHTPRPPCGSPSAPASGASPSGSPACGRTAGTSSCALCSFSLRVRNASSQPLC